ncbi:MAG TPA: lipocalin-like domain-containing protein [Anaerolineales bacterium]|nr:lipocalin-like domain-containing protein [Anaerolineales bacterium]
MKPWRAVLVIVVLGIGVSLVLIAFLQRPSEVEAPSSSLILAASQETPEFARALKPRSFSFPTDHGPHLEYQTEWWYYTGNLDAENGDHYGYQLTFFRRGLTPGEEVRESDLATTQIYFAHFAITDVSARRHAVAERFSRGTLELAGASGDPFSVWLEAWRVEALDANGDVVRLRASQDDMQLDLTLRSLKPITLHGDHGLSLKGEAAGNASYYLSDTRMETKGSIVLGDRRVTVTGLSWFDHEWSTSALPAQAVGWDWFSLQLADGRDVMFFQIRNVDGSIDPSARGTLVEEDGTVRILSAADITLQRLDTWRSPETGGSYPTRWRLAVPSAGIDLTLEPWLEDQEMRVSFPYWEGAVRILDSATERMIGQGYVELTGYAESMQGTF